LEYDKSLAGEWLRGKPGWPWAVDPKSLRVPPVRLNDEWISLSQRTIDWEIKPRTHFVAIRGFETNVLDLPKLEILELRVEVQEK
jgi:hypothetical protein